nr:cation:proton antiporter [uncultured Desulfuromonas sp.]
MHLDPGFINLVLSISLILVLGLILKRFKQPHVIGYLTTGVLLSPQVFGLVSDEETFNRLGALGVVLLLFFIGMEISPKRLIANWKVAFVGTLFQIILSVAATAFIGKFLDWPFERSILIGFVISLSSTAVVLKMLQDWNEMDSDTGQDVLGVLLVQDMAVIPMLIILGLFSGEKPELITILKQLVGGGLLIGLMVIVLVKEKVSLPLAKWLNNDHEMQVFGALFFCFFLALLSGLFELSTALGAFIGGIIVKAGKETQWVHHHLEPFRVIFIALFFVSIGLLLDLNFLFENIKMVLLVVLLTFLLNTVVNSWIMRMLGGSWAESLYAGVLLSQIGEFSFILAAVGKHAGIITSYGYQLSISVITLSLMFSPIWILTFKKFFMPSAQR